VGRSYRLALVAAATGVVLAGCAGSAAASAHRPRLPKYDQLFLVSRPGHEATRITHDHQDHYGPVWSPDGSMIADYVITDRRTKVEVLTASGDLVRRFDAGSGLTDAPVDWSPDGRMIAFASSYDNFETGATDGKLIVASVATGERHVVADPAADRPNWAPDGRSILYLRGDIIGVYNGGPVDYNEGDIWSVRPDGTGSHEVVHHVASPPLFFRAPGSQAAYALWTAGADGTSEARVTSPFSQAEAHWAPNGLGIWVLAAGREHARALLFPPSGERRRLPAAIRWGPMDWSDDGELIAWGDGSRIRAIRPDATGGRLLLRFLGRGGCDSLEWSPTSSRLLVACSKARPET
jgi:dipeptidyl aminopeptidase/acylaminoacyl peptidase